MNPNILREFDTLPPEAQKQVIDFIAFLSARYKITYKRKPKAAKSLADEPFIGMWKGREDMRDSVRWVRETRDNEWGK
jgi:hypothetical protein